MKLLKELTRKEFKSQFGTKTLCLSYLASRKWVNGYKCRKCDCLESIKGKQESSRRCKKCGYDESATAHTLFHKLKFGIENAFEMMYEISTSKKGVNSIWLAERIGVQQNTAWFFRQKVQLGTKSSLKFPLELEVHVDEFEIGTPKKRKAR